MNKTNDEATKSTHLSSTDRRAKLIASGTPAVRKAVADGVLKMWTACHMCQDFTAELQDLIVSHHVKDLAAQAIAAKEAQEKAAAAKHATAVLKAQAAKQAAAEKAAKAAAEKEAAKKSEAIAAGKAAFAKKDPDAKKSEASKPVEAPAPVKTPAVKSTKKSAKPDHSAKSQLAAKKTGKAIVQAVKAGPVTDAQVTEMVS
jgi:hypothetical protein